MKIRNWLIRKLGGINAEDFSPSERKALIEVLEDVPVSPSKIEFLSDPTAEEEQEALDEINKPALKRFLDSFKISK